MAATLRLTVLTGPHRQQRYCFRGPMRCTVGRANDCTVRLVGDQRDFSISRHHCQLDIDASIRVQDLGSLNGTYHNGKKLVPAESVPTGAEQLVKQLSAAENVDDGDIITIGGTSFKINVVDCQHNATDPVDPAAAWPAGGLVNCPIQC